MFEREYYIHLQAINSYALHSENQTYCLRELVLGANLILYQRKLINTSHQNVSKYLRNL